METTCHQSPILLHPFGAATSNGHLRSGHFGISKTNECLLQSFYWPNMESDISEHWQCFNKCQVTKRGKMSPELPLTQCTEPNQRVQADLFGPLKTSEGDKKFILCVDAEDKFFPSPSPNMLNSLYCQIKKH